MVNVFQSWQSRYTNRKNRLVHQIEHFHHNHWGKTFWSIKPSITALRHCRCQKKRQRPKSLVSFSHRDWSWSFSSSLVLSFDQAILISLLTISGSMVVYIQRSQLNIVAVELRDKYGWSTTYTSEFSTKIQRNFRDVSQLLPWVLFSLDIYCYSLWAVGCLPKSAARWDFLKIL